MEPTEVIQIVERCVVVMTRLSDGAIDGAHGKRITRALTRVVIGLIDDYLVPLLMESTRAELEESIP